MWMVLLMFSIILLPVISLVVFIFLRKKERLRVYRISDELKNEICQLTYDVISDHDWEQKSLIVSMLNNIQELTSNDPSDIVNAEKLLQNHLSEIQLSVKTKNEKKLISLLNNFWYSNWMLLGNS